MQDVTPAVPLKAGFVGKPNVYISLAHQLLELLQKSFAQLLIFFIRPRLGSCHVFNDGTLSRKSLDFSEIKTTT